MVDHYNSSENYAITAEGVTKRFGDQAAVSQLSFEIPRGTIFGFVGPSGCGKTTTIRLLTGVYLPDEGKIQVLGKNPSRFSIQDRETIGYLPQLFVLYPNLSVWENLNFVASLYGVSLSRKKRLDHLLDFVELSEHRNKLVRNISGGMQRRLSLATALVNDPQLLFLDEPTAGVDPILRSKFWDYFKDLQAEGHTLFITTQYIGEAAYCDLVGVMEAGQLLTVGAPEDLRRQAFGGDLVRVRTAEQLDQDLEADLQNLPDLTGGIERIDSSELHLIVDEAGTAVPVLVDWLRKQDLTIELIDEYNPPFDKVFVKLVKDTRHNA